MSSRLLVKASRASVTYSSGTSIFRKQRQQTNAVNEICLDIHAGKSIGVIGGNGSGKSTLLKLIAGIYKPDAGSIEHYTSSISLLALGAGYEPSIPAWDNVIFNGMLLGMSYKEIARKAHDIFAFAELQDKKSTPIKNYSAGMRSRLSFSTSMAANCDLLLIDELLAVGDAEFRKKSHFALQRKIESGMTVVLVSHQFDSLREICHECLWLEHGDVIEQGDTENVLIAYGNRNNTT